MVMSLLYLTLLTMLLLIRVIYMAQGQRAQLKQWQLLRQQASGNQTCKTTSTLVRFDWQGD